MEQLAATAGWAGLHGFISPLTSFVGREAETTELSLLLAEYRLVTVTGPGGMGKTRLAEVVARRAANAFADGVWMVELARVREPALVAPAVMSALGLTEDGNRLPTRSLVEALAGKQLLLVLDNCEHVLMAAAALCGELLAAADDTQVLATSRAPLGVGGEARYRLKPLRLVTAGGADAGAEADSVALFADRARRVDPAFVLDSVSRPQVARIVARLDGVPLAIELAAARVEAFGLAQLADGIDDHLPMMASSDLRTAARQRSMAATAKWSYDLLNEPERQAFRQLAVFPATFTLEAAEAVAGGSGVRGAVLRMVDWSLLCPPQHGPDGRARYLMLQTLRSYGLERVAACGEYHEVASRLASYSVTMAERAASCLMSPGAELGAAQRLEAEEATLQQSLAWAQDNEPETALRLAVALAPWWDRQGRRQVGYERLRRAAEHAVPGEELWYLAQLRLGQLSPDDYHQHGSLAHFSAVCDAQAAPPPPPLVLVEALIGRSSCLGHLGQYEKARSDSRRARAMAAGLNNADAEASALISLATIGHYVGDNDYSLACLQEAAQIDQSSMSADVALACQLFLARALGESGEFAQARELCAAALVSARETAHHAYVAECLATLAGLERHLGRLTAARVHLAEAVEAASGTGNRYRLLECLDVCGHLCAQEGHHAEALTIWAAREARWRDHPLIRLPLEAQRRERLIRDARQALGPDKAAAAQGRGAAMTLAAAAQFALLAAEATASRGSPPAGPAQTRLSAREQELVSLVAEGRTDAEIARQLTISIRTVRSHLDRIRDKTGCRRRADLTRLALQLDLI